MNKSKQKNFSAAPAGGGPGAEGARGRLQVGQEVQRLQHKQPLDKVMFKHYDHMITFQASSILSICIKHSETFFFMNKD